ncbi:nucleoside diphosphate kinase [Fimicolochytrium jonesii]|uniref:nucleoside diphosphate kinase n=1 Tax=Fimicolochytrium jonesii TaxID=1396493 RepID=UPI0022FE78D6|nr:nucleoside diphosphate kinase [Fimicolochytrium jonesii]KAI8823656.1 nucleoside diphosphate kinase [Fimicolochytrium jonesii]
MSAHARKIELAGAVAVTTDEDWNTLTEKPGLTVVDVYAKWAGPCEPMQNIFKRLKLDYGEQVTFATALTDGIEALESYRNKSCPTFLFFFNGVLVNLIKGANSPLIESTIKDQLDLAAKGQAHPPYRHGDLRVSAHTNGAPVTRTGGSKADLAGGVSDNLSATTPYTPMSATAESTLAIIKPDAMGPELINQIMNQIRLHRFEVVQKKKVWLSPEQVEQLYREHEKANYFQGVLTHMSTAPILALVLSKDNAVQDWRKLMGPANPATARDQAPSSIRASLGTDNRLNAVFGSESLEAAGHEIDLIFGPNTSVLELPMLEIKDTPPPAGAHAEKTLAIIKPDIVDTSKLDAIIERIICRGYQVIKRETINLSADQAADLYSHQKETPYFADTVAFMSSGPVVALVLKGYGVVSGWREMIGPTDPEVARNTVPMSIRAIFGTDTVRNAVHGSDGAENATREVEALFPSLLMRSESGIYNARTSTTAGAALSENAVRAAKHAAEDNVLTERTCALIKPDAFASGKRDEIVQRIRDAGFKIVAEKEVELTRAQAEEFYKEHLGQGFYEDLVRWMSTPDLPIYAMVLEKDAAITAWRELAGPTNSNKAREVAPNSIRAIYGKDGSKNAVHGSDSPQSAEREIKIIFGDTVSARAEGARPHQRVAAARSTTELLDPSGPLLQRTLALIKPDAYGAGKKDDIVKRIKEDGFRIVKESEVKWSEEKAKEFYREHEGKSFYDHLVAWMSSAPIYALVLEKSDGIKGWRDLAGPTNSNTARESAPQSIRALYGTDGSQNAVHGSDSAASAVREINIVFGNDVSPFTEEHQNFATNRVIGAPPSGILRQRTLALIKPDAYAAGHRDDIVARIQKAGFRIVQQKEIKLTEEKAGEFYREHASRPFYSDLVAWMSSHICTRSGKGRCHHGVARVSWSHRFC